MGTKMSELTEQLVARFQAIGEQHMRDLPIYNNALCVEAVDFQEIDQGWLGVLITPWFMNVMLFYKDTPPAAALGQMVPCELPSGVQQFMVGEDEELGRYDFLSLASPVLEYKTQQAAIHEARTRLQPLLTPAAEETEQQASAADDIDIQRRALLQGHLVNPISS